MTLLHVDGVTFGLGASVKSTFASKLSSYPAKLRSSAFSASAKSKEKAVPEDQQDPATCATEASVSSPQTPLKLDFAAAATVLSSSETAHDSLLSQLSAELQAERKRRRDLEDGVAHQLLLPSHDDGADGADGGGGADDSTPSANDGAAADRKRAAKTAAAKAADLLVAAAAAKLASAEAERDGLREIVHAVITSSSNDAVRYASKLENEGRTLPPDAIRLLEIMPWEESAQRYASVMEEVYEWEMYDKGTQQWTGQYRAFPDDFRCVPVVKPQTTSASSSATAAHDRDESTHFWTKKRQQSAGTAAHPSEDCVLTDEGCTHVIDVKDGYPLPTQGSWEWVGEWRVVDNHKKRRKDGNDKHPAVNVSPPCDSEGWSYASQPKLLVSRRVGDCQATAGGDDGMLNIGTLTAGGGDGMLTTATQTVERKFRRRKWTRHRVLVSYPSVSDMPAHFLALRAENARLKQSVGGLEAKVEELEEKAARLELRLRKTDDQLRRRYRELTRRLEGDEETVRDVAREQSLVEAAAGARRRRDIVASVGAGNEEEAAGAPAEEESVLTPQLSNKKQRRPSRPRSESDPTSSRSTDQTVAANTSIDNSGASSFLLAEAKRSTSSVSASAWRAVSRLYKISEAVDSKDTVHSSQSQSQSEEEEEKNAFDSSSVVVQPPAVGISPSLHKLVVAREDSGSDSTMDDTVTEPTSGSSSEESESDTLSILSSDISLVPMHSRKNTGGSGAVALDSRFLHTASSTVGTSKAPSSSREGVLDLDDTVLVRKRADSYADKHGDDNGSIQVGKEIYVTRKRGVHESDQSLASSRLAAQEVQRQQQPKHSVQVQATTMPFLSPTIRF